MELESDTDSKGFDMLRGKVSDLIGVDYNNYSKSHLSRRFHARMRVNEIPTFRGYMRFLRDNEEELEELRDLLTVNVTRFKRDRDMWDLLKDDVIPDIVEKKKNSPSSRDKKIKCWSAGCSTGEEPYSLSMCFLQNGVKGDDGITCEISATDLDEHALEVAKEGVYPEKSLENITAQERRDFLSEVEKGYGVKDKVKDLVDFKKRDILKDKHFRKYDIILCRYLMIYFTNDAKTQLMDRLVDGLKENGFLVIGMSENLRPLVREKVEPYDLKRRIFVKK